jgi:hypothetical protein
MPWACGILVFYCRFVEKIKKIICKKTVAIHNVFKKKARKLNS